jgi:hypothetical protein
MDRRTCLTSIAAAASTGWATLAAQTPARGAAAQPIVLHCDLAVDPAKETQMLTHFHTVFKPAASKFEGFIDLKMLKLRTVIQGGPGPKGINYRFQLTYRSEELRQKWVTSATHQRVWAPIDDTLLDKNFQVLLFDSV